MKRILIITLATILCGAFVGCKKIYNEPNVSGFRTDGSSQALFSVAPGRQVRFSRGNLQYNPKNDSWRFADHQYTIIGRDNKNISSTYNGWIDLFGWGTSGANWGSTAYQPWSSSTEPTDYFTARADNDLTGEYAQGDWGVHNAITNGGNTAGKWRTLTAEEWRYLVNAYADGPRKNRCCMAKIKFRAPMDGAYDGYEGYMGYDNSGEIEGLILLPDNWEMPSFGQRLVTDPAANDYGPFIENCKYELEEWCTLEAAGAVFLPLTMYRDGTAVKEGVRDDNGHWTESDGYYWSASCVSSDCAKAFQMFYHRLEDHTYMTSWTQVMQVALANKSGHLGLAVRLVQDY